MRTHLLWLISVNGNECISWQTEDVVMFSFLCDVLHISRSKCSVCSS